MPGDYYSDKLSADRLKQVYEIAPPRIKQYLAAELRHVLDRIRPGDTVLELGCGYGRVLAPISEKSSMAVGIDTSMTSLIMGRKELASNRQLTLVRMDAVRLSFRGGVFDLVVCIQNGISAFHVNPRDLIAESPPRYPL